MAENPQLVSKIQIGNTYEGRPIYVLKVMGAHTYTGTPANWPPDGPPNVGVGGHGKPTGGLKEHTVVQTLEHTFGKVWTSMLA